MRYTVIVKGYDQGWYSYGLFETYAKASKWAVQHLAHYPDDMWHIAQHTPWEGYSNE